MTTETYCWEDGTEYGKPDHTCLALDGHEGEHEWVPDADITVTFT